MEIELVYYYTANNEGVFSAGKRLLEDAIAKNIVSLDEVLKAKEWLPKPELPEGEYRFYFTKEGNRIYGETLLTIHKKYLENIQCHIIPRANLKNIVYSDIYQVVQLII